MSEKPPKKQAAKKPEPKTDQLLDAAEAMLTALSTGIVKHIRQAHDDLHTATREHRRRKSLKPES